MKQLSKSFAILSSSGLQNPGLVNMLNLTCKRDLYGLLAALLSCVKAYNNLLKIKMTHWVGKLFILTWQVSASDQKVQACINCPFQQSPWTKIYDHTGYNNYTLGFVWSIYQLLAINFNHQIWRYAVFFKRTSDSSCCISAQALISPVLKVVFY